MKTEFLRNCDFYKISHFGVLDSHFGVHTPQFGHQILIVYVGKADYSRSKSK